jgi:hypothetical protein
MLDGGIWMLDERDGYSKDYRFNSKSIIQNPTFLHLGLQPQM